MIQTARVPHRLALYRRSCDGNKDGPVFVGRSSRLRQSRGALDESSIVLENISMVFHQNHSSRSVSGDDDDSLSKYDFSLGAPSCLDLRSRIERMDSLDSTGFHVRDASRIARSNISQYKFESAHAMINEEEDIDDTSSCSSLGNDNEGREKPERDEILGSIREKVEEQKRDFTIGDAEKLAMLIGTKTNPNGKIVSSSVTHASSSSHKKSPKKEKGKMKAWFSGMFRRSNKHTDNQASQEPMNGSLQEQKVRRAQLTKTVSEMRRASF